MSNPTAMESGQRTDRSRRLSGSSSERIIFYVDDMSAETSHDPSPDLCHRLDNYTLYPPPSPNGLRMEDRSVLHPPSPDNSSFQLDDRSALYLSSPDDGPRRTTSMHSRTSGTKRSRNNLEADQRSSRRSSIQSSRSRTNSCSRPTPLGDGRRASISKRTKPRRTSTARRKDSVRPTRNEVKEARKVMEDARDIEQARRHRRIAMIVLGTFLFLLAASVLVVVVTLTHSSFLSPAMGSKELIEHRAQLRRENEELLNSLNRDFAAENSTVPP